MKKILAAAVLALALPATSQAQWRDPQARSGMTWLQGKALNTMPWIHFHGPLYNYGPYHTPGHYPMWVKDPLHGKYTPAFPPAYYGYEYPLYLQNTVQPHFAPPPVHGPAAPTNLYYSQGEPPLANPMASAPATSQPVAVQPSAPTTTSSSSRPGIFHRTGLRR